MQMGWLLLFDRRMILMMMTLLINQSETPRNCNRDTHTYQKSHLFLVLLPIGIDQEHLV